ncbi:MAG: FAD-dependent oxidoreductase [Bacteroidetes bacterium]|nr:MAG: FAD-dependent oxidoreductase [Bacteroidota bacterium]
MQKPVSDSSQRKIIVKNLILRILLVAALWASVTGWQGCTPTPEVKTEICIYGGSSAGVMAAVSAARLGRKVLLIEPGQHLGGLTAGGLSSTDIGNKYAVTGLSRDFYRRMGEPYGLFEQWRLEPSVAEQLFQDYVREAKVEVWYGHRLTGVKKSGTRLTHLQLEVPESNIRAQVAAGMFLDCTYEGDLLAAAGVSYFVGREANSLYGETYNGVQVRENHQFPDGIDPYRIPGDPASGLLMGISDGPLAPNGTGDSMVQAYNFRLCLTQDSSNQLPITRPASYNPEEYELMLRLMQHRESQGDRHDLYSYFLINRMPNEKSDWNHRGGISIDVIGENHRYPEADYDTRARIWQRHEDYIKGMLYFVGHDPRVPAHIREEMLTWGWAADEFTDNEGFPHQMYVREARRMIGAYVMTEHHCVGDSVVRDPIGLAAYTMDSHNCQRIVMEKDGMMMVKNEGNVEIGGFPPYPISYRALVPQATECTNLLVPVCLSASHIAYGSIRMEPVFMVMGQVAAIAADLALTEGLDVQAVDHRAIMDRYESDPLLDGSIPDVTVDEADPERVAYEGDWRSEFHFARTYGQSLLFSDNADGTARLTFRPEIQAAATYKVYLYCTRLRGQDIEYPTRTTVRVEHPGGTADIQFSYADHVNEWVEIGTFDLDPTGGTRVSLLGEASEGFLVADALLLVAQ